MLTGADGTPKLIHAALPVMLRAMSWSAGQQARDLACWPGARLATGRLRGRPRQAPVRGIGDFRGGWPLKMRKAAETTWSPPPAG